MKRLLYIIIGVTLLMTSCDKEESSNGDLEGFWQMTVMTSIPDASTSDMRSSGITWAFQGHILEVRDVNKVHQDIILSFKREGDVLKVSDPYLVDRDADDVAIEDVSLLLPYGIGQVQTEFRIIQMNSTRMVLESDTWHLEFRKY